MLTEAEVAIAHWVNEAKQEVNECDRVMEEIVVKTDRNEMIVLDLHPGENQVDERLRIK